MQKASEMPPLAALPLALAHLLRSGARVPSSGAWSGQRCLGLPAWADQVPSPSADKGPCGALTCHPCPPGYTCHVGGSGHHHHHCGRAAHTGVDSLEVVEAGAGDRAWAAASSRASHWGVRVAVRSSRPTWSSLCMCVFPSPLLVRTVTLDHAHPHGLALPEGPSPVQPEAQGLGLQHTLSGGCTQPTTPPQSVSGRADCRGWASAGCATAV